MTFDQQLTLVLIDKAVVGGFLALAVYGFNRTLEAFKSERAQWLENFKNQLSRKDEEARNTRLAVAELAKKIAAGNHSICWLCWAAKYSPQEVTEKNLQAYDMEMHLILSELVGSRVILAALDEGIHAVLSPLADKLYNLDVRVSNAKSLWIASKKEGLEALGNLHRESTQFDDELLKTVTSLVSHKHLEMRSAKSA